MVVDRDPVSRQQQNRVSDVDWDLPQQKWFIVLVILLAGGIVVLSVYFVQNTFTYFFTIINGHQQVLVVSISFVLNEDRLFFLALLFWLVFDLEDELHGDDVIDL